MDAKRPYQDIQVIMYMTDWCGYCRRARAYLQSLGVNLIEYNIEKDGEREREMRSKTGARTGVPVLDIEGTIIIGFSPDRIKQAVEKKRDL